MRAKDFDREKFMLEEWPKALESGEFKQGKRRLKTNEDLYCCLGVACELLSRKNLLPRKSWRYGSFLPVKAKKLLGILPHGDFTERRSFNGTLANINDEGKSFKVIARKIRSIENNRKWVTD